MKLTALFTFALTSLFLSSCACCRPAPKPAAGCAACKEGNCDLPKR